MIGKLLKVFFDGGPIMMSCILLCSIVALVIIIERFLYLKKIKHSDEKATDKVIDALNKGNFDEASNLCKKSPSPITNMILAGITKKDASKQNLEEAIKAAASREIPKLEKNLTTLGTIANVSTLIGLLGTVLGNMQAFGLIGSQNALGSMDVLAGGIAKALVTTAFGLIVSIPSLIFYNHFTHKVGNIILSMETYANDIVNIFVEKQNQPKQEQDNNTEKPKQEVV